MANYFIIGGDGKQYGPISPEDLRKWISENRVNARTQAQAEGAGAWQSLSDIPEFSGAFNISSPPPLPSGAAATPGKTSGLAITSLVLGILGMFTCGLTALVGLILGIVALVKVKGSKGALKGDGLALAGIIVSAIFLLMLPIFAAMMLPALAAAKQKAQEINCISNEKQLALAVKMYENDNNDHFPPAATWCDSLKSYTGGSQNIFKCPGANPSSRCDYAFNAKLDGLDESKADPSTVMIFESDGGWNASGGSDSMISTPRHAHMFVVALVDGSVQQVSESELNSLRWDP